MTQAGFSDSINDTSVAKRQVNSALGAMRPRTVTLIVHKQLIQLGKLKQFDSGRDFFTKFPMKFKNFTHLCLASLLMASTLFANEDSADNVRTDQPQFLSVAGKKYSASYLGMRDYVDELESKDQILFSKLDPDLRAIESKAYWAKITYIGGPLLGLGMSVVGASMDSSTISSSSGSERNGFGQALMYTGFVGGISAFFIGYFLLQPDWFDVRKVIKRHNNLNQIHKIELRFATTESTSMRPQITTGIFLSMKHEF